MKTAEAKFASSTEEINILIAEDEEYNYLFLLEVLSPYNIKLHRAYHGKMAVDICASNDNINLVLMDVRMPVMNGYEATKRIKEFRPDLPIIAQTAYALESDRRQALDEGFDAFITKPICNELLLELISKLAPPNLHLKRIRK